MMDLDPFWELIEQARRKMAASGSVGGHPRLEEADALRQTLAGRTPQEIVQFAQRFSERLIAGYNWDLWAALAIFNEGSAGDDRFEHFRAELILCGRAAYERALADADTLADISPLPRGEEGVLSVPLLVYEQITGSRFPDEADTVAHPAEPAGEPWDEEDLPRRLPRMWEKYGEG